MKITVLIFFFCTAGLFAREANSQVMKVSIASNAAPFSKIISDIEQQTDYLFVYDKSEINVNQPVTINAQNKTVAEVLSSILSNTDVIYAMEGENIMLMKRTDAQEVQQSNDRKISGTVRDAFGEPIIGASITVKGTKQGAVSDVNGQFSLTVAPDSKLAISYLGYITQEFTLGTQTDLKIVMLESLTTLEDVVVIGYGQQKKASLIGAVAAVNSEELMVTKTGNVQNALTGKIAGLKMMQSGSEPGSFDRIDFSIRGMGTPLIIIDGVPRDNIQLLDPNEVESISVLKDASAAIYGVHASNGVVLITTKRGYRLQKFRFEYSGYYGLQHDAYEPKQRDAIQYMEMINELNFNNNGNATYTQEAINAYRDGSKQSTDWVSPFIDRFPSQTQHNLSASGGSDKVDYFVNFGYYTQQYPYDGKNWKYDRYNIRSNITARLAKNLKLEMLLSGLADKQEHQPYNTFRIWYRTLWPMSPLVPYYLDDDPNKPVSGTWAVFSTDISSYTYNKRQLQSNASLEWEVPGIKGLKFRGMYSYDYIQNHVKEWRHKYSYYDVNGNIQWDTYNAYVRKWYEWINTMYQIQASYENTFNKVHHVNAMLLFEGSDRFADNFTASREPMLGIGQLFTGDANTQRAEVDDPTNKLYHFVNQSFVGRFSYDYASKYLAEFTFRRDGSSKFPVSKRWGFFPAGLIAYRISEESFIKDNPSLAFINNIKLRASLGVMGDDSALAYQFFSGYTYPNGQYVFDSKVINATSPIGFPNPVITWSTSVTKNIGLDVDLWNGLLGATVEFFLRDRDGLLATSAVAVVPTEVGLSGLPQENLNSDQTKGFELTLTHRRKVGKDFSYNITANFALDRSINKYIERTTSVNAYRNWRDNTNNRYGNILWGYNDKGQFGSFANIFNSPVIVGQGNGGNSLLLPGDIIYEDWNGDGVIDDNDIHPIATQNSRRPLITSGLLLGAGWKGFDFNLVLQGIAGHHYMYAGGNGNEWYWTPIPGNYNPDNQGFDVFYDRWHRADATNPSKDQEWIAGKYPSAFRGSSDRGRLLQANSTYWINNANFLRVKSLELGYTIPSKLTKILGMDKTRFFINGYNLLTFSSMKLSDPETGGNIADYPQLMQTFMVGANIIF